MNSLISVKLDDICVKVTDGTHDSPQLLPKGYPLIKGKDISQGYIDFTNCDYISEEEHLRVIARSKPEFGDILFANIGSIGDIAFVSTNKEFSIKNVALIKPDSSKVNNLYLYYYMLNKEFQKEIKTTKQGAAQPFISLNLLRNFKLKINKNISAQQKIAKILSNHDNLIENNNKCIKILEEMAQKIYKEWFVDFKFPGHETVTFKQTELGKIPTDWEIKKVCEISTLSKGKSYKSLELVKEREGLPFLNLKCVERDGGFRRDGLKWFDGKYNDIHIVLPEDVIIAVTDMTQERRLVARPARIPHNWYKKYIMSMDLVKLIANDNIDKSYFYSLLKYSNFSDEVKNHANGANVLHLNPQNIEQFELVVADKNIRDKFGRIVKPIFNKIDVLYLKNETLKQTRDLLLPRLISGEIDVENMEIV